MASQEKYLQNADNQAITTFKPDAYGLPAADNKNKSYPNGGWKPPPRFSGTIQGVITVCFPVRRSIPAPHPTASPLSKKGIQANQPPLQAKLYCLSAGS